MVKVIMGKKGSGKTKTLIDLINKSAQSTSGNIVCVEKGLKMTYDIDHSVRLIDSEDYQIKGFDEFYGFLSGILAGNYDIAEVYVDATLKIGGRDLEQFAAMLDKLVKVLEQNSAQAVFTVSCDKAQLPERLQGYIL